VTQQGYRSSITANISPIEAFDKISRVSDWWTTGVEGKSQSIGDEFTVRFGDTFVKFRVIELVPRQERRLGSDRLQFALDQQQD
jgi:hypothetical protein